MEEREQINIQLDGTERVNIELPLAILELCPKLVEEVDRCFYRCAVSYTENDETIPEDTMILHCSTAAVAWMSEEFAYQGERYIEEGNREVGESLIGLSEYVGAQMMAQILEVDIEEIRPMPFMPDDLDQE